DGYGLAQAHRGQRFGHGKAEALAALAQSAFITLSAGLVLWQRLERLRQPVRLVGAWYGVGVMLFSIIATLLLLRFQNRVIRRTGSTAIRADALHYRSDLLMNTSIIVALILAWYRSE